jgi:phosphoribosylaminoimidazole-succinocarboxamide synthase
MIHFVVPEVDAGEIIETCQVPIFQTDSLDTLTKRVQYYEKPTLLKAIMHMITFTQIKQMKKLSSDAMCPDVSPNHNLNGIIKIKSGKVRDIYDIGHNLLAMVNTNRFSSFDRHLCEIPFKGMVLNLSSEYWFDRTDDIIDNHLINAGENIMIVRKCQVIPIEVVIRQYITGSTDTALWTHYAKGERKYCGLTFPDGLVKNQKLVALVITPTTKNDQHDQLISADEIITSGLCTSKEWDYICEKSIQLFEIVSQMAANKGLILVDTKLEFGRNLQDQIVLIDEIFTCDSSRFWIASTYEERFKQGLAPESMDKDIIREYVRQRCDPYVDKILPEIPQDLIDRVSTTYIKFYEMITGTKLNSNLHNGLNDNLEQYIDTHIKFANIGECMELQFDDNQNHLLDVIHNQEFSTEYNDF